ncbi:1-deoxy-D-xylulose-5-phosphate reductoisomerase [Bacilli bacterium PM5-3]|nr:1-deoxy-D-xylulose-5-phosphate reductoisomerase [Bacilli bacterium PM5-3]MDH6603145.1 1-deoxy-D-xylulose-5-phosphate reductoisomerase [Bacilli bacterium PM5-9]
MKKIVILGASGSIGRQALDVIRENTEYEVSKISIGYNVKLLIEILDEFSTIKEVALLDSTFVSELQVAYPEINFYVGQKGILQLLDNIDYDIVLNAIVGFAGLLPSIKVIKSNKTLALANKETMVVGGKHISDLLAQNPQAKIIPVDSEHCAIFQCLQNNDKKSVKRLIISASGGSFRDKTLDELQNVSVADALNHPNWDMGASITIDSATMLNKGLEVIEAHWLFDIDYDDIEVVIHRESIVHSMVEYNDSSTIAQLSKPNMKQPIAYAFAYPNRANFSTGSLDLTKAFSLSFEPIDLKRFKGLKLSYQAGRLGHSYPCVLNAAKEVATKAFLEEKISFLSIVDYVEQALQVHKLIENPSIEDLIKIDNATRVYITNEINKESSNGNN